VSAARREIRAFARVARWLLERTLRHWPEESRTWGLALAAEINETPSPLEALRWSLGGILLFARAVFWHVWTWMKLPVGGSLSSITGPEGPSPLPRRSRLFTSAILTASAMLLFSTVGREAIRTVRASWQGFQQSDADERTLEKLAARAEKEKDANTLAFVGLRTTDPQRAAALVESAVSIDPELFWIYGIRKHGPSFEPPQEERLSRLQAADPGNAVPDLLLADALIEQRVDWLFAHGRNDDAIRHILEGDRRWLSLMARAYDARRYDSYFQRHDQLTRSVWNRKRYLSPTVVFSGLFQQALPCLRCVILFAQIKIHEARNLNAGGDLKRAASMLGDLDAFGTRMVDGSGTAIEKAVGLQVSSQVNEALHTLYSDAGANKDAQRIALRLDQIKEQRRSIRKALPPRDDPQARVFRREAMLVQCLGTLSVIAGLAALAGILLLELWPRKIRNAKTIWKNVTYWLADFAPAALLAACSTFLICFLPFQRAFSDYRSSDYLLSDQHGLADALWALIEIPGYALGVPARVSIWAFVTIALTALLLLVVVRGNARTRRAASTPG
jgi:hypothetical protein